MHGEGVATWVFDLPVIRLLPVGEHDRGTLRDNGSHRQTLAGDGLPDDLDRNVQAVLSGKRGRFIQRTVHLPRAGRSRRENGSILPRGGGVTAFRDWSMSLPGAAGVVSCQGVGEGDSIPASSPPSSVGHRPGVASSPCYRLALVPIAFP